MSAKPTPSFKLKLAKWIFFPLLCAVLVITFTKHYVNKNKCESECKYLGYSKSIYSSLFRGNEKQCLCLDPNDLEEKKKIQIHLK